MLARVDDLVFDVSALGERPVHGRELHKVEAGADDGEDPHIDSRMMP